MRWTPVSAALCLVTAGCNQIFGIDSTTQLPDEEAGIVEKLPLALRLTQQRATTQPDGTPVTLTESLTDAVVMIGPLTGDLQPTTLVDGAFVYQRRAPDGIPMATPVLEPLRAVIAIDGQPPLELQWTDVGSDATLAYTRIGRENAPGAADDFIANSGWLVEGAPNLPIGTVLFTTGSWWETTTGGASGQLPIRWDTPGTRPLGDTRVRPSAEAGDTAILAERKSHPVCSLETGQSTTFAAQPQEDPFSPRVEPTPIWSTSTGKVNVSWSQQITLGEAQSVLGGLVEDDALHPRTGSVAFGFLTSAAAPMLLPIGARATGGLMNPALLKLMECPLDTVLSASAGPSFATVQLLEDNLPPTVLVQAQWTRGADDSTFASGFEIVARANGAANTVKEATFTRTAPFATMIAVARDGAPLDLDGDGTDGQSLLGTGALTLTFAPEPGRQADYWSVSLIEVAGMTRTVERVVLTSAQQVTFEPPAPGTYVFAIRGHIGGSGARNGDFASVQFPQMATLATTRSFVVP